MEKAIESFSIFGGVEESIELDLFEDIETIIRFYFFSKYGDFKELINPSYLLEEPYSKILKAVARGDGRLSNIFRKARVGEALGRELLEDLRTLGVIGFEFSREMPIRSYPAQKVKKYLRSYQIEPKVRFNSPFFRFWFGFVAPFESELEEGRADRFIENFENHFSRLNSLIFEQLSNELLNHYFNNTLISFGSYWDRNSEFDIFAKTKDGISIIGECKYKNRKICGNELFKLKQKVKVSNLKADKFALFSKSGFSNELLKSDSKDLILFVKDFKSLLF